MDQNDRKGCGRSDAERLSFIIHTGRVPTTTCKGDEWFIYYPDRSRYHKDPWTCLDEFIDFLEQRRGKQFWLADPRGTERPLL